MSGVILNSWKEISSYIGRGVRTAQRWEELYGLPVHRPAGHDRSAVYALADELDVWLRSGNMHGVTQNRLAVSDGPDGRAALLQRIEELEQEVRELRKQPAVSESQQRPPRRQSRAG